MGYKYLILAMKQSNQSVRCDSDGRGAGDVGLGDAY